MAEKHTNEHKRNSKHISIGYDTSGQGVKGNMDIKIPDELLQKITESLALSIARKIVSESAEALTIAEPA